MSDNGMLFWSCVPFAFMSYINHMGSQLQITYQFARDYEKIITGGTFHHCDYP